MRQAASATYTTAVHETAHALVRHLLDRDRARIVYVTVEPVRCPDHIDRGHVQTESVRKGVAVVSEKRALEWCEHDLMMLMAGGVAQRVLDEIPPLEFRYAVTGDWRAIRWELAMLQEQGLPVGLGLLVRARRKVERLLRDNWSLLKFLADVLAERGTLSGREFTALIEAFVAAEETGQSPRDDRERGHDNSQDVHSQDCWRHEDAPYRHER